MPSRRLVPAAVGERRECFPVGIGGVARDDRLEGVRNLPVPRLPRAAPDDRAAGVAVGEDPRAERARRDQHQLPDAPGVPDRVQLGEVRARAVREHVDPVESEMDAQGLHVVGEALAAVRGGVLRRLRAAGAPQVEPDQPHPAGQAAEIAKVRRRLHRAAGEADHRVPVPDHVVAELRPVERAEAWHPRILSATRSPGQSPADPLWRRAVADPHRTMPVTASGRGGPGVTILASRAIRGAPA
ncbi:hypothetical protein HUW46_01109 [Amycolatopsis sp. CA-230715]|nr:hypothetical protein HUW46_01109 [Amycolatopsis sp. CA-230715]